MLRSFQVSRGRSEGLISKLLVRQNKRWESSAASPSAVSTQLDSDTGIATLTLQNGPANALSLEFMQDITQNLHDLEQDSSTKAIIVTSGLDRLFCAGLDLTEMYQPSSMERMQDFRRAHQDLFLKIYGCKKTTFAAIAGPAPAAGCMIALCCDYRVLQEASTRGVASMIGLNESQLGIVAPWWMAVPYVDLLGKRQAELALTLGTLYTPRKALELGLVDHVVRQRVVDHAKTELTSNWLSISGPARFESKKLIRQATIDRLVATRDQDIKSFTDFLMQDKVQQSLGAYLESLKKKKKQPPPATKIRANPWQAVSGRDHQWDPELLQQRHGHGGESSYHEHK